MYNMDVIVAVKVFENLILLNLCFVVYILSVNGQLYIFIVNYNRLCLNISIIWLYNNIYIYVIDWKPLSDF